MSALRKVSFLILLGTVAFLTAFGFQRWRNASSPSKAAVASTDMSDSARLAALGIHPGPQLIAYVFGSTQCGYCEQPDVKRAFASLRGRLQKDHGYEFAHVAVVGVAINSTFDEGMKYLNEIGLTNLDEISTGQGWHNEHVISLINYRKVAEPSVPLIVALERPVAARLTPFEEKIGPDTVLAVVQGRDAILRWVRGGTPLRPYHSDSLTDARGR